MIRHQLSLMLLLLVLFQHVFTSDIIVTLPTGKIRGTQKVTEHKNVTFFAFQEIPYAQPPVGSLRFMPPKPVEKWDGILNCTENKRICYQLKTNSKMESEDCLSLNVFTPVNPGSKVTLPVMYYIYGGGFVNGNAVLSSKGPHYLVEQEVVVVTVSYRVDSFGFLSTGDEVILGNMGLKDQSLGLKWVQENIHLFGGDPSKVTIFGQSAGAASVTYQILSKQSEGLFRGAIAQSGSALCPWAYQRNARSIAYEVANIIDPSFREKNTTKELLHLLQSVNASVLDSASADYHYSIGHDQLMQGFRYAPVIEPDVEEAFITRHMYELVENGNFSKVPLMIGICSEEALGRAENISSFNRTVQKYENDLSLIVGDDFHINDTDKKTSIGTKIRSFYTSGLFQDELGAAVKMFSDTAFSKAVIHHAQLHSLFADVYFYQFSYHGKMGLNNINVEGADRVEHGEDNKYLWAFHDKSDPSEYPEKDVKTLERYVKLFTDFAKTLNPTPKKSDLLDNIIWPKAESNDFKYLNINDTLEIKVDPKSKVYGKWVDLYVSTAVKPWDTF